MARKTMYEKALNTVLHSRFINLHDRLGRTPTDAEVIEEAKYQLEDVPYKGWDDEEAAAAIRDMKKLLRGKR